MPHADVVVIGAGLAGLTAALRLAESGAVVTLVAKGHASTHWGRAGSTWPRRGASTRPRRASRTSLRSDDHPYAFLATDTAPGRRLAAGAAGGIRAPVRGNRRDAHPPRADRDRGDTARRDRPGGAGGGAAPVGRPTSVLVVAGPAGFKDFWPAAIADSLDREDVWMGADRPAHLAGIAVELPGLRDRNNLNALELAHGLRRSGVAP